MSKNMDIVHDDVIGTRGKPWSRGDEFNWSLDQNLVRSYADDVLFKLDDLEPPFTKHQYGEIVDDLYGGRVYPLFVLKSADWDDAKPTVLITGGVHGYETSGVQGTLSFLKNDAQAYKDKFNIIAAPCVSPWGYETINRWNPQTVDPNRSFIVGAPACEEAKLLMDYMKQLSVQVDMHIDLHETTDTDKTVFREMTAARDGDVEFTNTAIDDGFYVIGDGEKPQLGFLKAIVNSVAQVTHIAAGDHEGNVMGIEPDAFGCLTISDYPGLAMNFTGAAYRATTEVYPDSEREGMSPQQCIDAQVEAIKGGLEFVGQERGL